jgi:hypothetical protein
MILDVASDGVKPMRDVLPRVVDDGLGEDALVRLEEGGQVVYLAEERDPAILRRVVLGDLLGSVVAPGSCGWNRRQWNDRVGG